MELWLSRSLTHATLYLYPLFIVLWFSLYLFFFVYLYDLVLWWTTTIDDDDVQTMSWNTLTAPSESARSSNCSGPNTGSWLVSLFVFVFFLFLDKNFHQFDIKWSSSSSSSNNRCFARSPCVFICEFYRALLGMRRERERERSNNIKLLCHNGQLFSRRVISFQLKNCYLFSRCYLFKKKKYKNKNLFFAVVPSRRWSIERRQTHHHFSGQVQLCYAHRG